MEPLNYSSSDDDLPDPSQFMPNYRKKSNDDIQQLEVSVSKSAIKKHHCTLSNIVEKRMYETQAQKLLNPEVNTDGSNLEKTALADVPNDDDDDFPSDEYMGSVYCDLLYDSEIFNCDQLFVLFNHHEVTLELYDHTATKELSAFEKTLMKIPANLLNKRLSTFLTCCRPSSITNYKIFILFLLKTAAVNPYPASVVTAQQILLLLFRSCNGQASSSILFCDIYDIFLNFGLDVNVYCPIQSLPGYLEIKTTFRSESRVDVTTDMLFNFNAVLAILSEFIPLCKFTDEELTEIILLLLWMNIDKKLSVPKTHILIQECIASALDKMLEKGLMEDLPAALAKYATSQINSEICDQLSIHILRSLPVYTSRGRDVQQLTAFRIIKLLVKDNSASENVSVLVNAMRHVNKNLKTISMGKLSTFVWLVDFCIGYASETKFEAVWGEVCALLKGCKSKMPSEYSKIKEHMARVECRIRLLPMKEIFVKFPERIQETSKSDEMEIGSESDTEESSVPVFKCETEGKMPIKNSLKSNPQVDEIDMQFEVESDGMEIENDGVQQSTKSMQLPSDCGDGPVSNAELSVVIKSEEYTSVENLVQLSVSDANDSANESKLSADNLDLINENFEDLHLAVEKLPAREMRPSNDIVFDNCKSEDVLNERCVSTENIISGTLQPIETSQDVSLFTFEESKMQKICISQQGGKYVIGNDSILANLLGKAKSVSNDHSYHAKGKRNSIPALLQVGQNIKHENTSVLDVQPDNVNGNCVNPMLESEQSSVSQSVPSSALANQNIEDSSASADGVSPRDECLPVVLTCCTKRESPYFVSVSPSLVQHDQDCDVNRSSVDESPHDVEPEVPVQINNLGLMPLNEEESVMGIPLSMPLQVSTDQEVSDESPSLLGILAHDECGASVPNINTCCVKREDTNVVLVSPSIVLRCDQGIHVESKNVDESSHSAEPNVPVQINNSGLMLPNGEGNEMGISQSMPVPVPNDKGIYYESPSLLGTSPLDECETSDPKTDLCFPKREVPSVTSVSPSLILPLSQDINTESRGFVDESPDAEPTIPAQDENSGLMPPNDVENETVLPSSSSFIPFLCDTSLPNIPTSRDCTTDNKNVDHSQATSVQQFISASNVNFAANTEIISDSRRCDLVAGSLQMFGENASISLQVKHPLLAQSDETKIGCKKSGPEVIDLCISDDSDCEIEYQLIDDVITID